MACGLVPEEEEGRQTRLGSHGAFLAIGLEDGRMDMESCRANVRTQTNVELQRLNGIKSKC